MTFQSLIQSLAALLASASLLAAQSLFINETSEQFGAVLLVPPDSLTVGQEFIAHVDRLDFVAIAMPRYDWLQQDVRIRQETIDGIVVATSSNSMRVRLPEREVFTFDGPVPLSPGSRYVIEVTALNTPQPLVYKTWVDAYPEGRLIVNGQFIDEFDMGFSVGVFVPQLLPVEALSVPAIERQPVIIAPSATFTNDYILDYRGAKLIISSGINEFGDNFSIAGVNPSDNVVRFEGRVIGYVTETIVPRTLTVGFTSHASAAAVQHTMRSIVFNSSSSTPPDERYLTMTFEDPLGRITVPLTLLVASVNEPPYASWFIDVPGRVVSLTPVVVVLPGQKGTVILDGSESYDPDSPFLDYTWNELIESSSLVPLANQGVRVTNYFSIGVHWVGLTVTDDYGESSQYYTLFRVMTPRTAITRILDSFTDLDVPPEAQRRLRAPLRQAALAIAQQRRSLAKTLLRAFQRRATAYGESDPSAGQKFVESAQTVIDGLSR